MIQSKSSVLDIMFHIDVGTGAKGSGKLWPLHLVASVHQNGRKCIQTEEELGHV